LLVANRRTRDALPAGVSRNIIEMVENGVDLTLWKPQTIVSVRSSTSGSAVRAMPARDEPETPGSVTFVYMGRLVNWKAVDLLLRAFRIASQRALIRLWILGEGTERERLEALASELGIASSDVEAPGEVRFAGWLSQSACAECLEHADCLVLPSLLECGGAVVLEAMSMGRPVIATAWGGPLDYLDPSCGVLVQPDSAEAIVEGLAAAMVDIARSDTVRRRMGESGRARVRSEFDWELKVDRMLAVYREVRNT
jgi:glycosyltransferase involved in cell wall biosynthesis